MTTYRQISWSLKAARLDVATIVSLWNLTGITAALLPMCLLKCNRKSINPNLAASGFTKSYGKTSYRLVNGGPECSALYAAIYSVMENRDQFQY